MCGIAGFVGLGSEQNLKAMSDAMIHRGPDGSGTFIDRPNGVFLAHRRLAILDEKPVPAGGVLVAMQAGELVAALPLDGGEALADPFKPTADAVALLRLRARQLRPEKNTSLIRWNRLHMPRGRLAA